MRVRTEYGYEPLDAVTYNTRRVMHNISDNANDDASAMVSASKRHDQRLLSSITNKLDEIHTTPPVAVKHHYYHQSAKPPLPPSAHHHRSVGPHVVVAAPTIKTVVLHHGGRASSVPPRSPRSAALQDEVEQYMEGSHRPAPRHHYSPEVAPRHHYSPEVAPRHHYSPERVHHRAAGMRAASEPPADKHHVANMAVKQAKLYLDRIETELGVTDSPYMVEDRSLYIPRPRAMPRTGAYHSHSKHYVPVSTSVRSTRAAEIQAQLDLYEEVPGPPPTSYSNLRHRTAEARDKLDRAKSMYDRYLPVYLGPETDVQYNVEHKYSELASRMPGLRPYHPVSSEDIGGGTAAYRPAPRSSGSYSPPVRSTAIPPVSDTRARIRQVLCKTKKDPGYY